MNHISSSAANDRENARRKDGKFGFQSHDKAEDITLPGPGMGPSHSPPKPSEPPFTDALRHDATELYERVAREHNRAALVSAARELRRDHPEVTHIAFYDEYEDGERYMEVAMYRGGDDQDEIALWENLELVTIADDLRGEFYQDEAFYDPEAIAPWAVEDDHWKFERVGTFNVDRLADGPPPDDRRESLRQQRAALQRMLEETRKVASEDAVEELGSIAMDRYPDGAYLASIHPGGGAQRIAVLDEGGNDLSSETLDDNSRALHSAQHGAEDQLGITTEDIVDALPAPDEDAPPRTNTGAVVTGCARLR